MMKKLIIGLFASSSIFIAVPAFAATEAEVVGICATQGTDACTIAMAAFLNNDVPPAQRAAAISSLAAALGDAALGRPIAQREVFLQALATLQALPDADDNLQLQIAQLNTTLQTQEFDVAAVDAVVAPGDVGQGFQASSN